jgi:hypothetical protein
MPFENVPAFETARDNVAKAGLPPLTRKAYRAFVNKLRPVNSHLLFDGALTHNGYGAQRLGGRANGKLLRAHRLMWIMCHGPVPDGLLVLHLDCINRDCCEPTHLYAGTPLNNTDDMLVARRGANGTSNYGRR